MQEASLFFEYIGNNSRTRILQYLIEGQEFDFTLKDLLRAKVSQKTLSQFLPKLAAWGIVIKTRKIGGATLYKINSGNPIAKHLIALYDNILVQQLKKREQKMQISA